METKEEEPAVMDKAKEFAVLFDEHIDLPVFGMVYAFSTRADNQNLDIPFCTPERGEVSQMPFPMQYSGGVNIPIASMVGVSKYKPQHLFADESGVSMELVDLPDGDGKFKKEPISVLEYTGVQGGGKTENVRLQLQIRLLAEATNRVPAKWARLGPRPSRIVGALRTSKTKGTRSTFMEEAATLRDVVRQLIDRVEVYLDEPGKRTVQEETCAIGSGFGYTVDRMGGSLIMTQHEEEVENNWQRLDETSRVHWYPLAIEYTKDPKKRFIVKYGFRGGAESFKIAEEMGVDPKTIELAELLYRIRQEFEEHKKRVL